MGEHRQQRQMSMEVLCLENRITTTITPLRLQLLLLQLLLKLLRLVVEEGYLKMVWGVIQVHMRWTPLLLVRLGQD